MDWNNDGKKDLITGERNGYIRIYPNTGTDAAPDFSGYLLLKVGGAVFDCGYNSMPHVVDWNGDGRKDVLCGEAEGTVLLLLNTGTDANPVFQAAVPLKDGAADLDVGVHASPAAADWNRDGKLDLLVGESSGGVIYFENKGGAGSPMLDGGIVLEAGGGALNVEAFARIDTADWDGDGVADLLAGNWSALGAPLGGVWFFHALGPLSLSTNALSAGAGGQIALALDAGAAHGGRDYLILGSATGTAPGIPLPGGKAVLPLNWDAFTLLVLDLLNTPVFQQFMGTLDGSGEGSALFDTLGPVPGAAGLVLHFAYLLDAPFDCVSNGAGIEILP